MRTQSTFMCCQLTFYCWLSLIVAWSAMANMNSLIEANQSIIFKKRKILLFFLSNKQATTKLQINILKRWKKQEYFLLRSKQHWFKITFNFCVCGKIQIISNIYQTCCISLYYRRLLTFYNQMQAKQNLLPCIPFLPAGHYSSFAL